MHPIKAQTLIIERLFGSSFFVYIELIFKASNPVSERALSIIKFKKDIPTRKRTHTHTHRVNIIEHDTLIFSFLYNGQPLKY
jgi:hypothetical protein